MVPVLTNHLSEWEKSADDLMEVALKRQLKYGVVMVSLDKASADPKANSWFDQERIVLFEVERFLISTRFL